MHSWRRCAPSDRIDERDRMDRINARPSAYRFTRASLATDTVQSGCCYPAHLVHPVCSSAALQLLLLLPFPVHPNRNPVPKSENRT